MLCVDEAAQFSAQLPILLKGVFFDGLKPSAMPKEAGKEQFPGNCTFKSKTMGSEFLKNTTAHF